MRATVNQHPPVHPSTIQWMPVITQLARELEPNGKLFPDHLSILHVAVHQHCTFSSSKNRIQVHITGTSWDRLEYWNSRWGRNSRKRSDLCRLAIRVFNTSSKLWSRRVVRSVPRIGPRILLLIGVALVRLTSRGQQLHSLLCFFTRPPFPPPPPTLSPPRNLDVVSWCFFLCFLSTVSGCSWLPRWYPCRKWIVSWLYWRRGFVNFTLFLKRCIQFS